MEGRTVELHPEALTEAQAALVWYQERNPAASAAFRLEIDLAVNEISMSPERWPVFMQGARRFLLRRFPFAVIYRITPTAIQILAFAHMRRKPGYWKAR